MTTQTMNIRDLTRNMKKITSAVEGGASFTVLRNAKPVFRIEPIVDAKVVTFTLADLKRAQFKGPKDMSTQIDKVAYGV